MGAGPSLLETPRAGTSPRSSSPTRATVIRTAAGPGIQDLPRGCRLESYPFLHTSPVLAVSGSGGGVPRTTIHSEEVGKIYVEKMSLSCPQPVWQSRCHSLQFLEAQAGILAVGGGGVARRLSAAQAADSLGYQAWRKQFSWVPPEAPSLDCLGEQGCSQGHFRLIIKAQWGQQANKGTCCQV